MKKRNLKPIIILIGFTMLFACNQSKSKNETTEIDIKADTIENNSDIEINQNKTEETFKQINSKTVDKLNSEIDLKKIKSEEEIMAIYRPKSLESEGDYQYNITKKNTDSGTIEVTLIETGIMDDSQAGQKVIMMLEKTKDGYTILSIKENYCCWKDRGHENWNAELCR